MMTITIYGSIGSRASRALWTAAEIGLTPEWNPISTLDGSSRSSEYLAISPSGRVPALSDGDVVMTESLAITMYLAQNYGHGGLWPVDRAQQARALQWTFWSATEIEYYIGAIFAQLVMKPAHERDQPFIDSLFATMMPKFQELEQALEGKDYILSDFTIADISVAVQTFVIVDRFGVDFADFPGVRAWTQRCRERSARKTIDALASVAKKG